MRMFLVLVALICCRDAGAADDKRPPAPPTHFEHDVMVRFHMHENFDLVRAIEKLLVRDNLVPARELARAIAQASDEPGLEAWSKHAARVRERAAALAGAASIDDGCRRLARLAEACAGCHAESGVLPELQAPKLPADHATVEARMVRHLWAADRLFEGMIGSSEESWRQGLDVLAQKPLAWPPTSARVALARQLQQLADEARQRKTTDSPPERARIYGEILVTCAACHVAR